MPAMKKTAPTEKTPKENSAEERIAKVLARAGLCSRREAESWILDGRVQVDGKTITSPALNVGAANRILVDNKPLPRAETTRLFRYHKPQGLITTARDPQGRPTVFDQLPKNLPRLISVGRLDLNSEGLLLLTNDGELARHLEHPSKGWLRRYRVRIHVGGTPFDEKIFAKLAKGVTVDGVVYGPIEASLDHTKGHNAWLTLGLKEGKNREIRRVMEHLGYTVNRLIRVSFGPFQLGRLEQGNVEEVPQRVLKETLGDFLGKEK
jgi:23S rRNA pseudouridine2605 synthase